MEFDFKLIETVFKPNISEAYLKDLYIDTGDFNRLIDKLPEPGTFLVYGKRGAGKTLLFNLLKTELTASLSNYYGNKEILNDLEDVLFFKQRIKKRMILPVFLRITRSGGTSKELLFDTVHEIVRNIIRSLILLEKISNKKVLKNYEPQFAEMLARLEEKSIIQTNSERRGLNFNIGGKIIPIELSSESSNEFTNAHSSSPIKELRTLHGIIGEILDIVKRENIEVIIALDEFDKISVKDAANILKAEQGSLFEALRSNFSFLIPANQLYIKEFTKPEYLGIFTMSPFELTPFEIEYTKEMIDKRLVFFKEYFGKKYSWKDIVSEEKLKEIIKKSNGTPRVILDNLKKEILNSKKLPLI